MRLAKSSLFNRTKMKSFYWFIRSNSNGIPRIHILSEDRKINLEYPLFDREIPATVAYVKHLLKEYFEKEIGK